MILSRITKALREQNWFAVAIEFVIVVAGVMLAFQITAWNETRGDLQRLELQAEAVRQEMIENRDRLAEYERNLDRSIEALSEFSAYLADGATDVPDEELAVFLIIAMRVEILQLKTTALEGLLAADNIVSLEPVCLLEAFEDWESSRQRLFRTSRDTLLYRDNVLFARFSRILPMDQVAATQAGFGVSTTSTEASLGDAINDHRAEIASIVAVRQIMSVTDRHLMRSLQDETDLLINALTTQACEQTP
jgi:hypothetical protein